MPDELDAQLDAELAGQAANAAAPSEGAATHPVVETPTPTDAGAQSATPTPSPTGAAATPAPVAPAQPTYAGARDYAAKALGYSNAGQYADDAAFLQAMIAGQQTYAKQVQEMQQLAQFGQLYLQQQSQAAKPQPTSPNDPLAAYKAPEFNPAWQNAIERTESGGFKLRDGADPSILPKFLAYQQHRQDVADKLLANPAEFLKPLVSHLVQEQAAALVEQRFGAQQNEQYVNGFMQQNAAWLYSRDNAGNPVVNPVTRQPMLSPTGQRFYEHLRAAEQYGIKDPTAQEKYARALLTADLMQPAAQTQNAVQQGDAAKAALLASMNRRPNQSGSHVGQDNTGHQAPATQNSSMSLEERLRANLRANGFTEESFAAGMA
jgi:hypothetical protein